MRADDPHWTLNHLERFVWPQRPARTAVLLAAEAAAAAGSHFGIDARPGWPGYVFHGGCLAVMLGLCLRARAGDHALNVEHPNPY